ncbi:hypothetical protein KKA14_11085 [bacterium]|nr:hypothetical protein [bacterium]
MTIKLPVKGLSANQLHEINQNGKNGWYPIGADNFWHGGVNFNYSDDETGSKPIRAIANGKIIAYRFTDEFCELSKTYDEGEDKNLKYYSREFSHNFVLIKHKHEPQNSPAIEYYSLYMHLAPFKLGDKKYEDNEVSIFKRWECKIKNSAIYVGEAMRNASGGLQRVIPKGAAVTIISEDNIHYKNAPLQDNRRKASCDLWGTTDTGFIWVADFNQTSWRCEAIGKEGEGVVVYKNNDPTSEVIKVLPRGTTIFFDIPNKSVGKDKTIKHGMAKIKLGLTENPIGFINVTNANVEATRKVINPVLSDDAQPCDVDIRAGEIIGWPGKDGAAEKNSFHFEIFTKNDKIFGQNGFWNITASQGKPGGVYKIAKDTAFFRKEKNDPIPDKKIPQNTLLELVSPVVAIPKESAREIKIVNQQVGWVLRKEVDWVTSSGDEIGVSKYHIKDNSIKWMWKYKPTTPATLALEKRDIYLGLRKTYLGDNIELTLLEKGTVGNVSIRKVQYTLRPSMEFNGWVKNETNIKGLKYTENGVIKKRFYATADLTELYHKNPEYGVFKSSTQKAKQDVYIFKRDCITSKDKGGNVWTGFPKKFIESDDIFFDKDKTEDVDEWTWLKGDDSTLPKVNIFDWKEFFQKCEGDTIANGEDGFCDAKPIFDLIDANKDGIFEVGEIKKAVKHKTVKHKLRKLVVEHPSEWFLPSSSAGIDKKWKTRLKGEKIDPSKAKVSGYLDYYAEMEIKPPSFGFNYTDKKFDAFFEIVNKTCFLHQVKVKNPDTGAEEAIFQEDERLWYFHPVAFVQHLKRLFADKDILNVEARNRGIKDIQDNIWAYYKGYQLVIAGNTLVPKHEPENGAMSDSEGYYLVTRQVRLGKTTYSGKEYKDQNEGNTLKGSLKADTFCNLAASTIAEEYGAPNLEYHNGMERSVNRIVDALDPTVKAYDTDECMFQKVDYKEAEDYASRGGFAIVVRKGRIVNGVRKHGHIATLVGGYDGDAIADNIKTYQAGTTVGYTTVGDAFGKPPTGVTYYLWRKK